jgi:DNA-3-methyladenine glycosylase II
MRAPRDPARSPRPLTPITYGRIAERMSAADPVLAGIVARWGPPPFWRHPHGFAGLVHGILAQQVSLESAMSAFGKLEGALGQVEPGAFLALDDARLREVGFSRRKAGYARGVAQRSWRAVSTWSPSTPRRTTRSGASS